MKKRYDPSRHHRRSMRWEGYDYTKPGEYFVNICTKNRRCIFGEVVQGEVMLSPIGMTADACWREIPDHFANATLDSHRIMPNHIHGIIKIDEHCRDTACRVPTQRIFGSSIPGSLSTIIGTYKSAVTKRIHESGHFLRTSIWQSRFYDHIIRDDISSYMIRQYIELNPLMWEFDIDNPHAKGITFEEFEKYLETEIWNNRPSIGNDLVFQEYVKGEMVGQHMMNMLNR